MKVIARTISRVFDPIVEIPLLIALTVWFARMNGLSIRFMVVILFVDALLPLLFFIHLLRKKEVADLDITKRSERIPIYGFAMAAHLCGVLIALLVGHTHTASILFVFWLLGVIFFIVTLFWKISVHAGVNSALATFLVLVGSTKYIWAYLVLIPVGWSRIYLKKHNLAQYVAGVLLANGLMWAGFWIFGLL